MKNILSIVAPALASILQLVQADTLKEVTEVRIRAKNPLMLVLSSSDIMLTAKGKITENPADSYLCTPDDLLKTLQLISKNSRYAFEEELRSGFITIKGGHRIGLCGQLVLEQGKIKTFKRITGMNIRLAREVTGCSEAILSYLLDGQKVLSTLIISPPRCGKTTLLRDIVKNISTGVKTLGLKGAQVGIVDERSEIAACQDGIPTVELGPRVDVLDACPKASGMLMLIRAMGPAVIATDELGREEDAVAVKEALNAGVSVLATVHGKDTSEVLARPYIGDLISSNYFARYIILDNNPRVGTIKQIISSTGQLLYIS